MIVNDLTGKTFGRLTAIERDGIVSGKSMWKFRCECGKEVRARGTHVTAGKTRSCGCFELEQTKKRNSTHGMSKTRPYRIWRDMINRCHYEKYPERHLYGGRGIVVCDRWRESFEAFIADTGVPLPNMSIDRYPNKDGNYEPGNCRWATAKEQAANRRPADRGVVPVYKNERKS